jgi:hypothetical protein
MIANSSELPEPEETAGKPEPLHKSGLNLLEITYIADDFDAPLQEDVLQDFGL